MSDPAWADAMTAIGTAITAVATVALAIVAGYAALTWRRNLREATRHETAATLLEQARLFRYLFYDARNPLYMAGEFPPEYYTVTGRGRAPAQEAAGWAHAFDNRWKLISPQLLELAKLRARAGALLNEEVATAIEELARKGRELYNIMQHRVEQIRDGAEVVATRADQNWVKRVREGIEADPDPAARHDSYSREFEEKFHKLEALVKLFL